MKAAIAMATLALSPKAELGRLLFFEPQLSGDGNISCADCHHPTTALGDGLSLSIGAGGEGLGIVRQLGDVTERVPRNAPPIFGLANAEVLFWDGRIAPNPSFPSGIESPAGHELPEGLDSLLAAQALFPVTSVTEMAGTGVIGMIAEAGYLQVVWLLLADRVQGLEYAADFLAAFPELGDIDDVTMVHVANAIAAFESEQWPADRSPYQRLLAGDRAAMSAEALDGFEVFVQAGCGTCHMGPMLTDWSHHAIAMPQVGPGKDAGGRDIGRALVTGLDADRYRFRTPPLVNVALTAPYGHSGAYNTLKGVVRHHLNPVASLFTYDCEGEPQLPPRDDLDDCAVMRGGALLVEIARANELGSVDLTDDEVNALLAFLYALTDPASLDMRRQVPR